MLATYVSCDTNPLKSELFYTNSTKNIIHIFLIAKQKYYTAALHEKKKNLKKQLYETMKLLSGFLIE